jgi:hypothetical protein
MAQRTAVPKQLRFQILRRDNHACRYCGVKAPDVPLTVDHVVPVALGGETVASNLVTACDPCNAGKTSTPPDAAVVEDVQADAVRWARAMLVASAIQMGRRDAREAYVTAVDAAWSEWRCGTDDATLVPRPGNWHESVGRWFDLGLEEGLILDAVGKAMRKPLPPRDTWRYFCGICWGILRERAEIARELFASEQQAGDA